MYHIRYSLRYQLWWEVVRTPRLVFGTRLDEKELVMNWRKQCWQSLALGHRCGNQLFSCFFFSVYKTPSFWIPVSAFSWYLHTDHVCSFTPHIFHNKLLHNNLYDDLRQKIITKQPFQMSIGAPNSFYLIIVCCDNYLTIAPCHSTEAWHLNAKHTHNTPLGSAFRLFTKKKH